LTPRRDVSTSRRFAGLCCFVGFDGGELAIDRVELPLELFLLVEDLLTLGAEPFALAGHEVGKVFAAHAAITIVGHSGLPVVDRRACSRNSRFCKAFRISACKKSV
jgi:hypothetical protein